MENPLARWNTMTPAEKQPYLWAGGGILVAIVVVVVFLSRGSQIGPGGRGGIVETEQGPVTELGTSPVIGGKVVAADGTPVKQDVEAGTKGAPRQSVEISKSDIPPSAVQLSVASGKGFTPNTFSVSAGGVVHLALTATDDKAHLLVFEDPSLSAVVVGVGPGQSRVISFNAPETPGEYAFRCGVPGHGVTEHGTMVVR